MGDKQNPGSGPGRPPWGGESRAACALGPTANSADVPPGFVTASGCPCFGDPTGFPLGSQEPWEVLASEKILRVGALLQFPFCPQTCAVLAVLAVSPRVCTAIGPRQRVFAHVPWLLLPERTSFAGTEHPLCFLSENALSDAS